MPGGTTVSVVVPVFNSSGTLGPLVAALQSCLVGRGASFEIVLVDDGSDDDSWDIVAALASECAEVRGIRLARNFGEHNAVLAGVRAARCASIVTIDDDLQQPPDAVPRLLDALVDDVDLVYGVSDRYHHGWSRQVAAVITKSVLRHLFSVSEAQSVTSFRAFRASLRDGFPANPGPLFSLDALLARSATRMATIGVEHEPRRSGRTNYTMNKLITHTMNAVVDGSPHPLRFATVAGALALVASLVTAFVVGVAVLFGDSTGGLAWLLGAVTTALVGLALVALGILGEYAARLLYRIEGQPTFIVAEETP